MYTRLTFPVILISAALRFADPKRNTKAIFAYTHKKVISVQVLYNFDARRSRKDETKPVKIRVEIPLRRDATNFYETQHIKLRSLFRCNNAGKYDHRIWDNFAPVDSSCLREQKGMRGDLSERRTIRVTLEEYTFVGVRRSLTAATAHGDHCPIGLTYTLH